MSTHETQENSFIAFQELEKRENGPSFTGTIRIDGVDKRIAVWVKVSATGNKFLTGQIQDKNRTEVLDLD